MKINNLKEWLIYKKGQVGTATGINATIGELMQVVELFLDETAKEKEVCEPKDTFKKEYIVIDKAPRWVTFNLSTGDFETEPYTHQDENFSNMCALQYCRCQS